MSGSLELPDPPPDSGTNTVTDPIDNSGWDGIRCDDGTGVNVYYINSKDFSRRRAVPPGFIQECFENKETKYYYRGKCTTPDCNTKFAPIFLTCNSQSIGYSFNLCQYCLLSSMNNYNSSTASSNTSSKTLDGEIIYKANINKPKSFFCNLENKVKNSTREIDLISRCLVSKYCIELQCKARRDKERFHIIKMKALEYGIKEGSHISWGLDKDKFDEYYGELDDSRLPHGEGVKFYSEGSVYVGGWLHGEFHSSVRGFWSRPDGSSYDGTWMNGMKHGKGVLTYPNGTAYEGEFAKGFEHGYGQRKYEDGSSHDGKFRFGRRDGTGVFTTKDGKKEKGTFRDRGTPYTEVMPPVLLEKIQEYNELAVNPPSLFDLCTSAVALTMLSRRFLLPSSKMFSRIGNYLKPIISKAYFQMIVKGATGKTTQGASPSFVQVANNIAFQEVEELVFGNIKIGSQDAESLMYFQAANKKLKKLTLIANKLRVDSVDTICKQIQQRTWLSLQFLNFSYNYIDTNSLISLVTGLSAIGSVQELKLQGCGLRSNGAYLLSSFLSTNSSKHLHILDLAFNTVEAVGADVLVEALYVNTTLVSLSLRQNNIGTMGGLSFLKLLKSAKTLQFLNLTDNNVGPEVIACISGKLQGSMIDIAHGVCSAELDMPSKYVQGRFDKWKPTTGRHRGKKEDEIVKDDIVDDDRAESSSVDIQ